MRPHPPLELVRVTVFHGCRDWCVLSNECRSIGGYKLVREDQPPRQNLERFETSQQHVVTAAREDGFVKSDVRIRDLEGIICGGRFSELPERRGHLCLIGRIRCICLKRKPSGVWFEQSAEAGDLPRGLA
jgi:hypothetical protein